MPFDHRTVSSMFRPLLLLAVGTGIALVHVLPVVAQVRVTVGGNKPVHAMHGAIGAPGRRIERPIVDHYDPRFGSALHGGGRSGDNPPVSNPGAWHQMDLHARRHGVGFVGVESEQPMYEPHRPIELFPEKATFTDRALPMSPTTYTSYQLAHADPSTTAEQRQSQHASQRDEPFLVVAYPGPPADQIGLERYREIANAGIDVIVPGNGCWDGPSNRKALDLAAKVGIRVIVTDLRILPWHIEDRVRIDSPVIETVVAEYRDHPALFGYFICDEPNAGYFAELAVTARKLQRADPEHPPLINLFPSYATAEQLGLDDYRAYVHSFIETVEPAVLCYDHYPLREPQAGKTDWFGDLALMRNESHQAGIPFWICLQSEGIDRALRVPKRAEILWQASTALAYGARGVVWFTYWTPSPSQQIPPDSTGRAYLREIHTGGMLSPHGKRTARYDHVREANRFLHEAGRALAGWDNAHVAHWNSGKLTGSGQSPCVALRGGQFHAVVGTFTHGGARRVVIANASYARTSQFSIEPQRGWRIGRVVAAQHAEKASEGRTPLQWKLAPGGCVVIECAPLANCGAKQTSPGKEKDQSTSAAQGALPIRPIRVVPLVFSGPSAEYEEVERWGLDQWTRDEIATLFDNMERDGINMVVLPVCFGKEVVFASSILPNKLEYDAYEMLFDLATKHKMQVVIPGISYTYHWQFQGKPWDAAADLEMNKRICRELAERYGNRPSFWGWYIPHETGDRTHRGDVMTVLRGLPPYLKTLTPGKKVAHSPWFTSPLTLGKEATTPAEFAAEWDAILSEIDGIDVFAIQDSTAPHNQIGAWFAAAAPVFKKHGAELWSVVELFPRETEFTMGRVICFQRLLEKMTAASPYVTAYACWEYQNYLNPRSPLPGAAELSREYRAYFGSTHRKKAGK